MAVVLTVHCRQAAGRGIQSIATLNMRLHQHINIGPKGTGCFQARVFSQDSSPQDSSSWRILSDADGCFTWGCLFKGFS